MTDNPHAGDRPNPRDVHFALGLALVHVVVIAVGMLFHEMWRDEWQAWLFARDSDGITELLRATRYEGHPVTWHLLLYVLSRFTRSAAAMQVLHLLIASTVVWIVARWSPLTRLQKVLFAFGYWPAYEYAVISRGYALGALALFGACAAWSVRRRSWLPLAAFLALLAQTSAYGAILALAFAIAALCEMVLDPQLRASLRARTLQSGLAALLVAGSVGLTVLQVRPPSDADFTGKPAERTEASTGNAMRSIALIPVRALLPFPRFEGGAPYWGETEAVDGRGLENAPVYVAFIAIAFAIYTARRPFALVMLAAGTAGLLFFAYRYHYGYLRHHGHLVLLVIAACWLARSDGADWPADWPGARARALIDRAGSALLTTVLIVHTVTWAVLYGADLRFPFTGGKDAAEVLARNGADRTLIIGGRNAYAITLAGYLDQPVFYLEENYLGTYVIWDTAPRLVGLDSVLAHVQRMLGPGMPTALLTTHRVLPPERPAGLQVEPLYIQEEPVISPEVFYVYRVSLD